MGLMPRALDNSVFGCNNYCSIRNNGSNGSNGRNGVNGVNGVNGDDGGKNAAEVHGGRSRGFGVVLGRGFCGGGSSSLHLIDLSGVASSSSAGKPRDLRLIAGA